MSLTTFRDALAGFQSRPALRPLHDLESLRARYWDALSAELSAEPCTPERRKLAVRTLRIGRMAAAVAQASRA